MAPKAQTARQSSRGTSSRRARQDNLPYPLSSPTAASYRSPPWQQRVDVYAQNYLVPAEIATCRQLGLRFLPTEARLIASQLAGSPSLSLKVRQLIGSLYIYDLAYGLLHDMKSQLRAVLGGGEEVETNLVANLLNNIRGYRIVKLVQCGNGALAGGGPVQNNNLKPVTIVEKPWAGLWQLTGRPADPADPEINMKVLSSTQENVLRSKGYVILDGMPYTVERYPLIDVIAPPLVAGVPRMAPYGRRDAAGNAFRDSRNGGNNFLMAPYSLTGAGGYAVESCINMLIELCNDAKYNTSHFTQQSRMNVFYPLGLEGSNSDEIVGNAQQIAAREQQNGMLGLANLMGNYRHPAMNANGVPTHPDPLALGANGVEIPIAGTVNDNVLRKIQVPGSITGASRTQNAAVMEHQRMILTQRDLLGRLGQWIETGEGILAYGGVSFGAYRRGDNTKAVMGNRPATSRYMEANYTNDTCGAGYERVWYTGQPDDPKSSQVPGYLSLPGGRTVKNIKAKVATCAPVMPRASRLPGSSEGPNVMTNMVYPTIPRTGGVVAMQRRKKKAATKRK